MSQVHNQGPTVEQRSIHTVHDHRGNPILEVGTRSCIELAPDGTHREIKWSDYVQLADGLVWSPGMLFAKPPVLLTCCATCSQTRASTSLLAVRNARVCAACGRITCPRHRVLVERQWRCRSCASWIRIKELLLWPFCSRED